MITVTENAVKQLHTLITDRTAPGGADGLRLSVVRGGCAGMEYQMKLDAAADGDFIIEQGGVRIYIDAESQSFLQGCEVDYSDELTDSGFKVNNPNAARSCGCGSSFEPKQEGVEPSYEPSQDGVVCGDPDA